MPSEPEDRRHLTAAQGYLELGMFLDADAELEEIDPGCRHLPEVLAVRLEICRGLKKWNLMETVARRLAEYEPENVQWPLSWAYATRRVDSIAAARAILLKAVERHPEAATVHFNLACYECQLGNLELARGHLKLAFKLKPQSRMMALEDEDLEALWESLASDT